MFEQSRKLQFWRLNFDRFLNLMLLLDSAAKVSLETTWIWPRNLLTAKSSRQQFFSIIHFLNLFLYHPFSEGQVENCCRELFAVSRFRGRVHVVSSVTFAVELDKAIRFKNWLKFRLQNCNFLLEHSFLSWTRAENCSFEGEISTNS